MQSCRLFLAINLPEGVKEDLLAYQEEYSDLPLSWTPKANLHITLVFLGATPSEKNEKIKKVALAQKDFSGFRCRLKKVVLAPPGSTPRMFWVRVEKKSSLLKLQKRLEKDLAQHPKIGYQEESDRDYLPHITLGRIDQDQWKKLRDRKRVTEKLDLDFFVDSYELMESELKPSGAKYKILKTFSLK